MRIHAISPGRRVAWLSQPVRFGFTFPDFLLTVAALGLVVIVGLGAMHRRRANAQKTLCMNNLRQVNQAVLSFANDRQGALPLVATNVNKPTWWWYKEMVKGYVGLKGPSSPRDKVFACPRDRGYEDNEPFYRSAKSDFQSYSFNGVNIPGVPNLAGRTVSSVRNPAQTLLTMEWTAHAPLSWHDSKTGQKNHPFYNDALSMVGYVDGGVKYVRIYYDGVNPAFTRDPIPGYDYKYSGD
jgi:hypothetical protein